LQDHVHLRRDNGTVNGQETDTPEAVPQAVRTPIWEAFIEASLDIPDEALDWLPSAGAV
jgi:hypothetical protein